MPQAPYGDAESLFRAAHHELMRVVALRAAGYEYGEIAASLGVSVSTVRSHISNARKQLSRTVARDWEGAQG